MCAHLAEGSSSPLTLELDLDAVSANVDALRGLAGAGVRIIAAIKADGYGLGALPIARHLARCGVDALATGSVAEARAIRAAGIELPVMLLASTPPDELAALCAAGLTPTVTSLEAALRLAKDLQPCATVPVAPAPVYIKVDVGLGRLGIPLAQAEQTVLRIHALDNIAIAGIYTHAPFSTRDGRRWAQSRLIAFDRLLDRLEAAGLEFAITQARASAALLAGLTDRCNAVCVGHALFGFAGVEAPAPGESANLVGTTFRPTVERLRTRIIQVTELGRGSDVAIAGDFAIEHARTIAVLPVGVGHGVARARAGRDAAVLIGGHRARVLATSLEHTTVEIPPGCAARAGDEALFIGRQGTESIPVAEYAADRDLSPLDAMIALSGRVRVVAAGAAVDSIT